MKHRAPIGWDYTYGLARPFLFPPSHAFGARSTTFCTIIYTWRTNFLFSFQEEKLNIGFNKTWTYNTEKGFNLIQCQLHVYIYDISLSVVIQNSRSLGTCKRWAPLGPIFGLFAFPPLFLSILVPTLHDWWFNRRRSKALISKVVIKTQKSFFSSHQTSWAHD